MGLFFCGENLTYLFLLFKIKQTIKIMKKIDLKSVVWKEGRYYVSQCLDVDVASYGKTKKEALKMLQEALELYFEDIPIPKKSEIKNPSLTLVKLQLQHA